MTRHLWTIAAIAFVAAAAPALAQADRPHDGPRAHADTTAMRTPCPLHLTTLALTPVQDSALRAIRVAHMAEMRAVAARLGVTMEHGRHAEHARGTHPRPDAKAAHDALREPMQASMSRANDAVRAILAAPQRATFDAAVAAHAAEKAERERAGIAHDCAACCRSHDQALKREG